MDQVTADRAQKIQAAYNRRTEEIRGSSHLTAEAKRGLLAGAYRDAKRDLDALQQAYAGGRETQLRDLNRRLFSIDVIAGPAIGGDRASAVVAHRDAQDRVAQIVESNPDAARPRLLELLARADRSGDEYLARAVADAALQVGDTEILEAFASSRPHTEQPLVQLLELAAEANSVQRRFSDSMQFAIAAPSEVGNAQGSTIDALADGVASIGAGA